MSEARERGDEDAGREAAALRDAAEPREPDAAPASRHAPRLSYEAVVRLHCDGRRGIHTGFVRDISRGGMFLRLVDPEPAGKRLGFELFLPGWRAPARGVGEVAWERARYEGPGRPPGMALRFVALEPVAIEMLARVLPDGEPPAVEVLQPRPLPVPAAELVETSTARERADAGELANEVSANEPPAGELGALSLEELIAEARIAPQPAAAQPAPTHGGEHGDHELADLDGPMIFVPPPPLPVPVLAGSAGAGEPVPLLHERAAAAPVQRLRWGSAAAGIAAFAGLATLAVVGAARREVAVAPVERGASAAVAGVPAAAAPQHTGRATATAPAANVAVPLAASDTTPWSQGVAEPPVSPPTPATAPTAPATEAASAPARRLVSLRWEPLAAGGTRVVVTLDGALGNGRVRSSRIAGEAPRVVVRLLGVGAVVPQAPWEPGTPEVRRVRAGRHDGDGGGELHLVLDLAAAGARLASSEIVGNELRLDLVQAR